MFKSLTLHLSPDLSNIGLYGCAMCREDHVIPVDFDTHHHSY